MDPTTVAEIYTDLRVAALGVFGIAILLAVLLPIAAVTGFLSGARRRASLQRRGAEIDGRIGETTIGAVLALLGLLLAFSFGNALSISQERKHSMTDEAAALGTAFLRADYLDEPGRTALQQALRDYARTRVIETDGRVTTMAGAQAFLARTLTAQAQLWPATLAATAPPTPAPVATFVAGAVNDVLDAHLYRVQVLAAPIHDYAMAMLLAAAMTALFLLGNRSGMLGRKLTWRTFVFSGFLWLVMTATVDLMRPLDGNMRMDQTALIATIYDMEAALAERS